MAQLVEDLLVAARVDAGGIEVEAAPVNLSEEVARVVSGMRSHRAIAIRSNGECVAVAEAVRVRQILRNLLTNAVRYGGPSARADCWTGDGVVVVAVSDDGPVIDTAARELIFEPYQRAHQEPTQPASVGLGLTVSRNLARLMGGDLRYLREAGRNVFELTLPASATGESGGPGS
jgi:signal transduction histidine kinase